MKMKEVPLFNKTMDLFFTFFEKHNIKSSLLPLHNHNELLNKLSEAYYLRYNEDSDEGHYGLDMRPPENPGKFMGDFVFMFYFENSSGNEMCHLFIDLSDSLWFIDAQLSPLVSLPFDCHLPGRQIKAQEKVDDDTLLDTFNAFLEEHSHAGEPVVIVVD